MNTTFLKLDPLLVGVCEWCGKSCSDLDAVCSTSCEAQVARLEAVRGRIVLRALMRWRRSRGSEKGSFMELSRLVDGFLRDDRLRRERAQEKRRATSELSEGEPRGTSVR